MPAFKKALTATEAIAKLSANDPTFVTCDLSNNAIMQMKGAELAPQLAEALKGNSTCSDLNLTGCNLDDGMVEPLAAALATNSTLTSLNLEANKVNNDGAVMISTALKTNRSLPTLNLLNQKGTRFGDKTQIGRASCRERV